MKTTIRISVAVLLPLILTCTALTLPPREEQRLDDARRSARRRSYPPDLRDFFAESDRLDWLTRGKEYSHRRPDPAEHIPLPEITHGYAWSGKVRLGSEYVHLGKLKEGTTAHPSLREGIGEGTLFSFHPSTQGRKGWFYLMVSGHSTAGPYSRIRGFLFANPTGTNLSFRDHPDGQRQYIRLVTRGLRNYWQDPAGKLTYAPGVLGAKPIEILRVQGPPPPGPEEAFLFRPIPGEQGFFYLQHHSGKYVGLLHGEFSLRATIPPEQKSLFKFAY
jgi:hypothetical protein